MAPGFGGTLCFTALLSLRQHHSLCKLKKEEKKKEGKKKKKEGKKKTSPQTQVGSFP